MTEPGIGPSIDQEKTLCGIADPDHCVGGGGGGGGLTMGSSKLACRGLLSFVSNVSHRKSWHRRIAVTAGDYYGHWSLEGHHRVLYCVRSCVMINCPVPMLVILVL